MVHMRPRISRGFPSTISSAPILSRRTFIEKKTWRYLKIIIQDLFDNKTTKTIEGSTNFGMEEGQAFVDVFDLVDSHLAIVGFGQLLARDNLQQLEQFLAVGKVHKQVLHLHTSLSCIIIAPK